MQGLSLEPVVTMMITKVYLGVLVYFLLGAFVTLYIARNKEAAEKRHDFLKYAWYLLIVNIILLSVIIGEPAFTAVALIIIFVGYFELIWIRIRRSKQKYSIFFLLALLLYTLVSIGFWYFTFLEKEVIIYCYILVMVSDASSQHSGQLFGRRKIFGRISPNKTLEGVIGGMAMVLLTSTLLHQLVNISLFQALLSGMGVSVMANVGDISASFYKRRYRVKDFSRIIPGHGGFLDRFDSFLVTGASVYLYIQFISPLLNGN